MATITTRAGKGSPLTNTEVDSNFTNLNTDKLESTDLSVSTGTASGGGTLSYSAGVFTFAPADLSSYIVDLSSFTTTDLTEGTNLYYTDERVDDRVNTLIQAGLGITTSYDDINNELTIESDTVEELCKNGTASTIAKGTPVYQTGTSGNAMIIAPADASSSSTMPAVGVLSQDLAAAAEGNLILMGRISGVDTSSFSEGDVIYVANGGGYTNVRPTGQSVLVQNLGRVTKVDSTNGGGVVMGSGRANDVPNLTDGYVFIGNSGGTYDKRALVAADITDATVSVTDSNLASFVTAFTLPTSDGTSGQALVTDGSGTIAFGDVDALPSQTGNSGYFLTTDGSTASWAEVAAGEYVYDRTNYTATSSQTTFSATYDVGYVDVFLNGVKLIDGTDFTATNGTSIVLSSGAVAGDLVEILAIQQITIANTYTTAQADAKFAQVSNNLSDLANAATARTNLGLGTIATAATSDYAATANNLSDLASASTALTNLGLTATAAEINYLDITTLGTTEASKAVTADANGVVTFDNGISEEYTAVTSTSNATTVNLQDGTNFSHTLTENTTFTFSNPAASGKSSSFTLKLVQDASASGYTVTWPTSVDWPAATAPTLTATASAVDYFVFITHDGGTTWYGFTAGQALA